MDRKSIPKPVRVKVWDEHIGEENGIGKCNVCGDEIKSSNPNELFSLEYY